MKPTNKNTFLFVGSASLAALLFSGAGSYGATLASDNASDAAYQTSFSDWGSGDNGGFGFNAWSGLTDIYVGSSAANGDGSNSGATNIDTTGPDNATGESWALRGDGGTNGNGEGFRTLIGNLSVGQSIQLGFDNGFIAGGSVGFSFRSGGTNRFEYYYQPGGANNYKVDGSAIQTTTQGFTDDGMLTTFTLTGTDTYSFSVDFLGSGTIDQSFTGTLKGTAGTGIDTIRLFNFATNGDPSGNSFYNSVSVVPEPSSLGLAVMAGLGVMGIRRRRS